MLASLTHNQTWKGKGTCYSLKLTHTHTHTTTTRVCGCDSLNDVCADLQDEAGCEWAITGKQQWRWGINQKQS